MALIGVTTYETLSEEKNEIVALNKHYVKAILQAGGTPVLIPSLLSEEKWKEVYARLDGVLFTGGGDIDPQIFNGQAHPRVGEVDPARDQLEIPMLQLMVQQPKPFLGICRGLQVANVALGGTLYTHIEDQHEGAAKHDYYPDIPRNYLAHPVRVEEGSRIAEIFGEPLLQVNSLHHQGIKDLAPSLKAVAYSPDDIIEAVELPDHPFCFAVQWHPECITDQVPMQRLFRAFVQASEN